MLVYNISGKDYDSIGVTELDSIDSTQNMQYYMQNGKVVRTSAVEFDEVLKGLEMCVTQVITDDEDTVIFPSVSVDRVSANALRDTKFRRVVIPSSAKIIIEDRGLYGSDYLKEVVSLSDNVEYESGAIPVGIEVNF